MIRLEYMDLNLQMENIVIYNKKNKIDFKFKKY